MALEIKDLHVSAGDKEIIKGVSLGVKQGEFHVLMGPNGSGKTTLAMAVMGYGKLKTTSGDILIDGKSVLKDSVDSRARMGLFLSFQNPVEVEGLGFMNFMNAAKAAVSQDGMHFREVAEETKAASDALRMKEDMTARSLNYGLSGGEKKKLEILQMEVLKPRYAMLDEPDSGLDVDAIRTVADEIERFRKETNAGVLLITHYSRMLDRLRPQFVHVMHDGRIVKEGGREIAEDIEKNGYRF